MCTEKREHKESLEEPKKRRNRPGSEVSRKDDVKSTGYTRNLEIRKTYIPLRNNYLSRDLSLQDCSRN